MNQYGISSVKDSLIIINTMVKSIKQKILEAYKIFKNRFDFVVIFFFIVREVKKVGIKLFLFNLILFNMESKR